MKREVSRARNCGRLKDLQLEQYAERFAENAIDPSVLPDLTDQDLEKMGVLLGHRRKIRLRPRHSHRSRFDTADLRPVAATHIVRGHKQRP